jgi:hypothetical protein
MASVILGSSTSQRVLTFASCFVLLVGFHTPVAMAQHPAGHFGGGIGAHAFAPPISRPPLMRPPISRPRMYIAPRYAAFGTGRLLFRAQPFHQLPPISPVVGHPFFFFGWPFWPFGLTWGFPGYGLGWGFNYCYWMDCSLFWNWQFTPPTQPFYEYTPPAPVSPTYSYPIYEYGEERRDSPQLFLKDGSVYNVRDYWRVDDQVHFTVYEPGSPPSVEHVIDFDQLDLQKTINVNTARGFRFVMRDEPMEQYQHDHPNQIPPKWALPSNQ